MTYEQLEAMRIGSRMDKAAEEARKIEEYVLSALSSVRKYGATFSHTKSLRAPPCFLQATPYLG